MKPKRILFTHPTQFSRATTLCAAILFSAAPGLAQFTGDNQTNIIDGTALNWPGYYRVGATNVSNALFILNGGFLSSGGGLLVMDIRLVATAISRLYQEVVPYGRILEETSGSGTRGLPIGSWSAMAGVCRYSH